MLDTVLIRAVLPRGAGVKVVSPRPSLAERQVPPTVTVIIPCYNYGHYINTCVESVLSQRGVSVNVIVIDDASPDGSGGIVAALPAADRRVRAICHKQNMGHISTYNEGLDQAEGDYAVLLSADDLMTPGCLARATSLMEAYPEVGMTYGFSVDIGDGPLPPARTSANGWVIWQGRDWIEQRCRAGRNILRSPEAVVRTSIQRKIGGYRADLPHAGDLEMWMRVASVAGIGYVAGADQAYYRVHATNMHHSSFNIVADLRQRLESFDSILGTDSLLGGDRKALSDIARRAIAQEALQHAISLSALPVASQTLVDGCYELAMGIWPEAQEFREWRSLNKMRTMGQKRLARQGRIHLWENMRKVEYSLRWRRRRLAGF